MMTATHRASGALFGLAFGDALGARTEFLSVEHIVQQFGPAGPQDLQGDTALVTDDTQMALAVGEALVDAPRPLTAANVEPALRRQFVKWYRSPENTRAPGNTCLAACARLEQGLPWKQATVPTSKGCGANMRVAPVGLMPQSEPGLTTITRAAMAQFQAALTHGHPTALAAADLTAATIFYLASSQAPAELPAWLRHYAQSQRHIYHGEWLGSLWERPGSSTPEDFIARGWDECLAALDRLDTAVTILDQQADPCLITGAGWIAEEALATGLLCFLLFPEDPVAAIRRAATSSGDSDSIACLAGAFAGAALGMAAWPTEWRNRIEYQDRLTRIGASWDSAWP